MADLNKKAQDVVQENEIILNKVSAALATYQQKIEKNKKNRAARLQTLQRRTKA